MFSGAPLRDSLRSVLFSVARDMIEQKQSRQVIHSDFMEGEVITQAQTHVMGGVTGVKFHAHVEWELGKTTVDYIVRAGDLPDYDRASWMSIEDYIGRSQAN